MRFFDTPEMLYAAPAVAVLIAVLAWWARRVRMRHAGRWSGELLAVARARNRWSAFLFALVALIAMVAMAGPRWGRRIVETETKGLNLVIAVDVSRSMLAEDVAPSRLVRARNAARRLIHDLPGDRIGLIAFAGRSFILSPLTVDGGALTLLIDGLDPELTSAGGTELSRVLRQGRELLLASSEVADRVLVVFTDGEAHDSVPSVVAAAAALRSDGIHLILVAEGDRTPVRIPVRAADGSLVMYQKDESGKVVETARRDDVLSAAADAAEGAVVAAALSDQAGAVHDLVAAYKRAPSVSSTAATDISRAWIPLLVAIVLLLGHTVTRRSAALAGIALAAGLTAAASAQAPRNRADEAWARGDMRRAAELYLAQVRGRSGGDTAWLNAGTAALALGDTGVARTALGHAAESLDRHIRFRALYNLGLLELRLAARDSAGRDSYLAEARRRYREALLLLPDDSAAKWNLELATRLQPPSAGGGGAPPPPSQGGGGEREDGGGLTESQAEQILRSMAQEEARTRASLNARRQALQGSRTRRDW